MASVLLLGLFLAGTFFVLNTRLRRHGDERLYRRVTLALIATTFAVVGTIIVAIKLGYIADHYT